MFRIRGPLPLEWRRDALQSRWYTHSCASYSLAGLLLLWMCLSGRGDSLPSLWSSLSQRGSIEAYTVLSLLLVLNGILSYMADVHTFGRKSVWKDADVVCSTVNLVVQI